MSTKITKSKAIVVEIICTLLILLFTYAALSKLLEFQNFQAQLGQSPLLSAFTGFISYSVILVEVILALLLTVPKSRAIGLLASFTLMLLFTVYIVIILNYSSFVPCSCGGILEKLGWKEHLVFNIGFTVAAAIAILLRSKDKTDSLIKVGIITFTGTTVLIVLYVTSEQAMHRENPFIRRFIQGASKKTEQIKLHNNTLYFAGTANGIIYLSDYKAPLHIFAYDTLLKTKKHFKIQLEREDFPFQTVQVKIFGNQFYLMDGTVPIIYKGDTGDWKAKILMTHNNYYFSKAEVVAPGKIVFRAQQLKTGRNILGTFSFTDSLKVTYAPNLLQKQIDGFFDTDGMLNFDKQTQQFVYLYYYRNQFMVTNNELQLKYRGHTIDTAVHAKLKVTFIKDTKQRKLAAPPFTVNQLSAVDNQLLFVNSKLVGKFEPKEMWKEASIIDIYNTRKNSYLSSVYIYDVHKSKVRDMLIIGNNLYAIIGQELHKYHLNFKVITQKNLK